jgi:hypothetical protein
MCGFSENEYKASLLVKVETTNDVRLTLGLVQGSCRHTFGGC